MTIVRNEHRTNYTVVPNEIFVDRRLSAEAKGVLCYLLSRPLNWQVRLDHVGGALAIGRKKLQRIFRELMSAGYVSRAQWRLPGRQQFDRVDYVVRDVPEAAGRPVDNSLKPQVRERPAVSERKASALQRHASQQPRGPKRPGYKVQNNKTLDRSALAGSLLHSLDAAEDRIRSALAEREDAALDQEIVAMFGDRATAWELLCELPDDELKQLRQRVRLGVLDGAGLSELWHRYRHLLSTSSGKR